MSDVVSFEKVKSHIVADRLLNAKDPETIWQTLSDTCGTDIHMALDTMIKLYLQVNNHRLLLEERINDLYELYSNPVE